MHDVQPHLYATAIREMIRHENDLTNHRIMWLLIVQGLIANAYVSGADARGESGLMLAPVGILVTLSAFVILYKSYQARGYLQFVGNEAKRGTLRAEDLPLQGWPKTRLKGWRRRVWPCPWVGEASELLEPFFFLPGLLVFSWLLVLAQRWFALGLAVLVILSAMASVMLLFMIGIAWVWWQSRYEVEPEVDSKAVCSLPTSS